MTTRKQFLKKEYKKNESELRIFRKLRKDGKKFKPYIFMSQKEKYLFDGVRKIGYLDIESSGLVADFDIMISYAVLVRDIKTGKYVIRHSIIRKSDFVFARRKKDFDLIDKRITQQLMNDIGDCDVLIGHWFIGKHRHDIPFIRTRCAINKVSGFPKHRMIRYGDTQKWGSQIHRLHSYGLSSLADAYGVSTKKTEVRSKQWKNALLAIKEALDYILEHNIKDVIITYRVHKRMEQYVPLPNTYF